MKNEKLKTEKMLSLQGQIKALKNDPKIQVWDYAPNMIKEIRKLEKQLKELSDQ